MLKMIPAPTTSATAGPTVLHLTLASDAGGLSRYIIDLASATRNAGWNVVVAGDVGVWQPKFDEAGLEYIKLPLRGAVLGLGKCSRLLREKLLGREIDLIHSHYRRATMLGRRLQREHSPPIVNTLHLSHLNVSGWRKWFSDFGDHLLIASKDARSWAVNDARFDGNAITCIPHGIDLNRWPLTTLEDRVNARLDLNIAPDASVMLYVGRLDDPKNIDWIAAAHLAARENNPAHITLMVGQGPDQQRFPIGSDASIDLITTRHTDEAIDYPGLRFLGERDPLTPYRAADLFVLASYREGFSYVCAEAMATGLPVLRTRTTGTTETIIEGITGQSVPIEKDQFIARALTLLADPVALRKMGHAAAAHARSSFSFERQLASTLKLYNNLAGR